MYEHDMTEQAYKNGYEAGKKEAQAEIEKKDIEIDILIRKKNAAYDEIARLKARMEEFVVRLKEKATGTFFEERRYVDTEDIDNLVEEMGIEI
jgi:flagellar biosynthesis/type III secretory pathway protein FliH